MFFIIHHGMFHIFGIGDEHFQWNFTKILWASFGNFGGLMVIVGSSANVVNYQWQEADDSANGEENLADIRKRVEVGIFRHLILP